MNASCGVGGNAIAFAQTREHVIAIDNGETRLRLVRHNATIYGVVDRIDFVPGDFTAKTSLRISLNTLNSDFQVSRQSMITSCLNSRSVSPPTSPAIYHGIPIYKASPTPLRTRKQVVQREKTRLR